jgi:hypothetical protein
MAELAVVPIRYDGLDAEYHRIELHLLGESLQGLSRILAVCAHFIETGQYAKQMQALNVKVYVDEAQSSCYMLQAFLEAAKQQQLFAGLASVVLAPILGWIFTRASNQRAEMKALKDSLDKALALIAGQNSETIPKLLATVDKMADSLLPSARAAVAPVGRTCATMQVGAGPVIDQAMADAIRSPGEDELTEERSWRIRITELDLETRSGKVRFEDEDDSDDGRVRAVITDPALDMLTSPYTKAFASHKTIQVRAKAILREGEIHTLYISNTEGSP